MDGADSDRSDGVGHTYIVTTHMLPEGHPLFAAMMRSLPAGLIALGISRQLPHGSWWRKGLVLGTLNMGALIAGEALTPIELLGFALARTAMVAGQLPSPKPKVESARLPVLG